eukprot:6336301-Ditylum_brightwellii.AAC.1
MTHVLNYALQDVLVTKAPKGKGATTGVDQKGSLVDESKLRFDFSWNAPLTASQLADIEGAVNARIEKALPVDTFVA